MYYDDLMCSLIELESTVELLCSQPELDNPEEEQAVCKHIEAMEDRIIVLKKEIAEIECKDHVEELSLWR